MSAFDNIIGYNKEKQILMQLCDISRNKSKYDALGIRLPQGILLHGEPGVGKTLMATALIEEMGRKSYVCRKDQSNGSFIDTVSDIFEQAKEHAPSVILLDDLDKFPADTDTRNPEELIAVQSGIDSIKGCDVFVIATANNLRVLPVSLRRAGRFDRIMEVHAPDRKESVEIIRHYLADKVVAEDVEAEEIARMLQGESCAALESVLNTAGIYAGYENAPKIARMHVMRAILQVVFDAEESESEMSQSLQQEIAFHEAGHAATALTYDPQSVGVISIRSSKDGTHGITQLIMADEYFQSYQCMRERVITLLAGKAAVELKFGRVDVGAVSDIERALKIINRFVTKYGVCGLDLCSCEDNFRFEASVQANRILTESGAMLSRLYAEAKSVLHANWTLVEQLADELMRKQTLYRKDIEAVQAQTMAACA